MEDPMTQALKYLNQRYDMNNKKSSDVSRSSKEVEIHRRDVLIKLFTLKSSFNQVQGLVHGLGTESLPVISQLQNEVSVL